MKPVNHYPDTDTNNELLKRNKEKNNSSPIPMDKAKEINRQFFFIASYSLLPPYLLDHLYQEKSINYNLINDIYDI